MARRRRGNKALVARFFAGAGGTFWEVFGYAFGTCLEEFREHVGDVVRHVVGHF